MNYHNLSAFNFTKYSALIDRPVSVAPIIMHVKNDLIIFQFGSFQYLTKLATESIPHDDDSIFFTGLVHTSCGSLSGVTATMIAHPIDVLRTRFAVQKEPKV